MKSFPLRPLQAATLALALALATLPVQGSVVITGTRVIYPGDAREKTVQMTNLSLIHISEPTRPY